MGILSGLYADPIKAVIRELSVNANESHKASGNKSPIKVTFPSTSGPTFIIKDEGLGLDIDEFGKLPGIGPKSAQRIAFHLLSVEPPDIDRLTAVLARVRDGVQFCEVCGNVSEAERCRICADARRDGTLVCVVEEPKDVQAVERTREFRGRYHVLGGALDPLSGIGPDQLRIRQLLNRIGERVDGVDITEVIIATDPNTEGEATATYLLRILRDIPGLTVSRIASGLPMGGDLEFADELTLGRALAGRRAMV
jgi:recombination protein RecR